jgi:polysaccharide pyruvyl transferase WcaK-like protein
VLIGGSNLFDTGRRPPMGTLRLLQCVLPALVARRIGTPYVLLGHTLGPVSTRLGRLVLRTVVRNAELTVAREEPSAAFVREALELEPGPRMRTAPDLAFALPACPSARVESIVAGFGEARFAVLVPRSYHHADEVRDARLAAQMVRLGRAALDTDLVDVVLVFPQCLGPTAIEDDRVAASRIASGDPRFRLLDVDVSPGEIVELFRSATFVVAVRLHAAILAMTAGTPVHGIEYFTSKTRGVFAAMHLDDHWSEFDAFDGVAALGRIRELLEPAARELIGNRAADMRAGVDALVLVELPT